MQALSLEVPAVVIAFACVVFLAGLVRGFSGFGGPAVMILSMTPFYAPISVLSVVAVVDLAANVILLPAVWRAVEWRTAGVYVAAGLVGVPIGLLALQTVDPLIMKQVIAWVAVACTLLMLAGWRLTATPPLGVFVIMGLLASITLGATMIAFVAVVFLLATPAPEQRTRANLIIWGFTTGVTLLAVHLWHGNIGWQDGWRALLLSIVYIFSTRLGNRLFQSIGHTYYRRFVLWFLLILGMLGIVA